MAKRKSETREEYLARQKPYQDAYRIKNAASIRVKVKAAYVAHRGERLARSKAYYDANSEKRKAYQRSYGESHIAEQKAYNALRPARNRTGPCTYIFRVGMTMIYVGRSDQVERRLYRHDNRQAPWAAEADSVEIRHHGSYGDSLVHEAKLIAAFQPKYNVVGVTL